MGQHHQRAKGMHTDRTRDDNGELRQKRGDTLVGNIEREYGVDFGVRSDMRLDAADELEKAHSKKRPSRPTHTTK
jgi:hypothetical protein